MLKKVLLESRCQMENIRTIRKEYRLRHISGKYYQSAMLAKVFGKEVQNNGVYAKTAKLTNDGLVFKTRRGLMNHLFWAFKIKTMEDFDQATKDFTVEEKEIVEVINANNQLDFDMRDKKILVEKWLGTQYSSYVAGLYSKLCLNPEYTHLLVLANLHGQAAIYETIQLRDYLISCGIKRNQYRHTRGVFAFKDENCITLARLHVGPGTSVVDLEKLEIIPILIRP